ncbi:MAG: magnesium chelatase ATPase subunit I, partial [Rhizobacter sp.]|nr:magnesium chelatase ATPase subunit I [Chlorobiales bacterium]
NFSEAILRKMAELCVELAIDGHRGELTLARASKALAAYHGRTEVLLDDVRTLAPLCLAHRLRKDPLETSDPVDKITEAAAKILA